MDRFDPLEFEKYHGAGNDYVLIDGLRTPRALDVDRHLVTAISNRHTGVGGDGLIVLGASSSADLRMHMWNADGSRGAVCGNGLRCAASFAHALGIAATTIESDARVHLIDETIFDAHNAMIEARVGMGSLAIRGSFEIRDPEQQSSGDGSARVVFGDTGNPHAVVFVRSDPELFDLSAIAADVRRTDQFEDGVNVELAFVADSPEQPTRILQRTHERGSGETLACGSGATFVAAVALDQGLCKGPSIEVTLRGGTLLVDRLGDGGFALRGPVARSFGGVYPTTRTW